MKKPSSRKLIQLMNVLGDNEFHDGTALGETLHLTRSAVWKMMRKLTKYGINIESVKGKGYVLQETVILLDENRIREHLNDIDTRLSVFEAIDSTNEYLKTVKNARGLQFCVAEFQSKGRGRLGRQWVAPFAKNISLSCLLPFHKDISELAGLSLVISLAVLRTLQHFGVKEDVYVKWPNDVLCQNKKISGILIEIQAESHGVSQVIIGVGLNVNILKIDEEKINQPSTSLREVLGQYFDRNLVCAVLINQLQDYIQRFVKQGFQIFIDEWVAAEGMKGKKIALKTVHDTVRGEAAGINDQGHLLLRLPNGEIKAFSSGDTTILKEGQQH